MFRRLKVDSETIKTVCELVRRHENRFEPTPKSVKRLLGKIGPELFEKLLVLMEADEMGKREEFRLQKSVFEEFRIIEKEIIEKNECFMLKDLVINGKDLISEGFEPGKKIGEVLETLLEKVIEGEVPNEKSELLVIAKNNFR